MRAACSAVAVVLSASALLEGFWTPPDDYGHLLLVGIQALAALTAAVLAVAYRPEKT